MREQDPVRREKTAIISAWVSAPEDQITCFSSPSENPGPEVSTPKNARNTGQWPEEEAVRLQISCLWQAAEYLIVCVQSWYRGSLTGKFSSIGNFLRTTFNVRLSFDVHWMGHLYTDTMMGSGHFPEVHLYYSNMACTDNKVPRLLLAPTWR